MLGKKVNFSPDEKNRPIVSLSNEVVPRYNFIGITSLLKLKLIYHIIIH